MGIKKEQLHGAWKQGFKMKSKHPEDSGSIKGIGDGKKLRGKRGGIH